MRIIRLWSSDHAWVEALSNGFIFGPGYEILETDVPPWSPDGTFLSILLGDEAVFEPLFCPIASNPLDSSLALTIILFRICFIHFCQFIRQIFGCSSTSLSAPFLAAVSKAINFNLKGFKGFLLLDQQELASGEFM